VGNEDVCLEAQLPMMRRIARRYATASGSPLDHEDLLHAAVVNVLERVEKFDPARGSFTAFCRVWTLDGVRRALARRGRCAACVDVDELAAEPSEVEIDDALHLAQALEQLPERARRVIVLRFSDALRQREVAQELGVTRDCVKGIERDAVRFLKSPQRWPKRHPKQQ
jgi:RNA polymerase sigma factor (sigma-70 family)